jgi:hypothetical protein
MMLKEMPWMLWSDHESIFVVNSGAKWVEMTDLETSCPLPMGMLVLKAFPYYC